MLTVLSEENVYLMSEGRLDIN